ARIEPDSTLVLTRDAVLRLPGTSKVRAELPAGTRLTRTASLRVRAQGKTHEVELWGGIRADSSGNGGFGESVAVLAVFPEGESAPSDVAEVQTDRETYLRDKLVSLGGDDAFEIVNAHLNAGEDHNQISLFHLRQGRLRRIGEINIGAQRGSNCQDAFRQRIHWVVEPKPGALPTIVADVETIHAPMEIVKEDCPDRKHRQSSSHARTTYRWDKARDRYVKATRAAPREH
ncbi:MAG: hypothetical protein WBP72_09735, partial [Rhodocyclaceae bacterium]